MKIYMMFSLISLTFIRFPDAVSEVITVKVDLNANATLPCRGRCPGSVTWTEFRTRAPVAQCDPTSCTSLREGFRMSHDQFLSGDWSLFITGADYRKRNLYTCNCDGTDLCDVTLRIHPHEIHSVVKVGGSLSMSIPVAENLEVEFRSDDVTQRSAVVCKVKGHRYECEPEYNKRSSLSTSLHLNNLSTSDSGVYTITDTDNKEVIFSYKTVIKDSSHHIWLGDTADYIPDTSTGVPVWIFVLVVVLLLVLQGVVLLYFLKQRWDLLRENSKLKLNNEQMLRLNV